MRYEPDHQGMQRILNTPAMANVAMSAARSGMTFAQSISPRRTGEYAQSFRVEPTTVRIKGQPRSAAHILNTSGHAQAVEWGEHGHKVLGRTLEELRRRYDRERGR